MAQAAKQTRRSAVTRKSKRAVAIAKVHIFASFNNTIITVSDQQGNTICWTSSGQWDIKAHARALPLPPAWQLRKPSKWQPVWAFRKLTSSLKGRARDENLPFERFSPRESKCARFQILPLFPIMDAGRQRSAVFNVLRSI